MSGNIQHRPANNITPGMRIIRLSLTY